LRQSIIVAKPVRHEGPARGAFFFFRAKRARPRNFSILSAANAFEFFFLWSTSSLHFPSEAPESPLYFRSRQLREVFSK
jgi:hypothetical protein